ncbi:hypothetical protein H6F77_07460 [Microcoleus sp. FACHB-831]|jgi:hypothetical protein|uniref:hypothetical protein n=1 Tax=Microcoleus sp. FACHB-831 TaxID=2692827 RepID=UPI0016867ACD|nr:hypothetical protein [Microcoleus sp. FACHB-831]MBD1920923.1 hypothetical protein [Microcoleus sp. FACHB-831]
MNQPASVNLKMSKIALGAALTLACLSLETLGSVAHAAPAKSIPLSNLADGTYLFGEIPRPNQLGMAYVVFQRQKGKVVGAFYYPSSGFDCFSGNVKNNALDVKSENPNDSQVAKVKVNLTSMYPIKQVSSNDQRIISACKKSTAALANR